MDLELKGKVAIVTGGSVDIGLAVARDLAKEGVNLLICARDEARVSEAAREIGVEYGVKSVGVNADVSKSDDIARVLAAVVDA